MKGTDPIISPGMNFEGARRGRSNMRMAVVVVVLLHVALFTGILFQACSKTEESADAVGDANQKPSLAEEMAQIVNQPPEVVPTTQPLPPLPSGNAGLPPLPATGITPGTPPIGLPPDPATLGGSGFNPPVTPPPVPIAAGTQHVVASGENFWTLSKKHGVSHKDIVAANPTVIPTRMKIGQKITIPPKAIADPDPVPAQADPAFANDGTTYIVKSGDTLGHIALRHKVKLQTLKVLNPNVIPTKMKIGQKLKLPAATQPIPVAPVTGITPQVDPATGLPVLPPAPGFPTPIPNR
jgi:LysM repeat protein